MKESIILSILMSILMSLNTLATDLYSVSVRYKKNGVNHTLTIQPYGSGTINPDHGSQVRVLVWRQPDISTPVEYFVTDWDNFNHQTQTSSYTYVIFEDCAGPFDTQLTVGVNSMVGAVNVNVNWQQPALPDLIVSNVSVDYSTSASGKSYHVGQTVKLNSAVWNIGGATAGSSKLGYYIKTSEGNTTGSPFTWRKIYSLQPGQNLGYEVNYTFTSNDVGTRYFVFEADYLDEVDEANENNNVKSFGPFTVISPPSLTINPTNQHFGSYNINECSSEFSFLLSNDGGTTVSGSANLADGTHFTIISGGGNYTLNAGQSKEIKIKFCPESAGTKNDQLRVYMSGQTAPITQSSLSGTGVLPPEVIIGISDEFVFDTRRFHSGGIFLKVIETAGTDMVKYAGYRFKFQSDVNYVYRAFEIDENGYVFLEPPVALEDHEIEEDFSNQIFLFDENQNQIGHINFSYSFKWEGMHSRHAILFFHNDDNITGADQYNPYFPYNTNSPNNYKGKTYSYYQFGEYPVSMLIPPHFQSEEYESHPEGYRFPYEYAGVKPIVFVHGLWGSFSYRRQKTEPENTNIKGDQVSYWYHTERTINHKKTSDSLRKYHAWQFYYPSEDDLRHCGMMLREAVNYLFQKYESYGEKIGIMAHSMGGLVTMDYLTTNHINYNNQKIGKIFLSMSPLHGSIAANRTYHSNDIILDAIRLGGQLFGRYLGDKYAPCYRDMSLGSEFLNTLHNRNWSNHLNLENIISLVGLTPKNYILPKLLHKEAVFHEDGIVGYSSASLLDHGIGFLGIYGNHDDGKYGQLLDEYFIPWLIDKYFSSSYDVFKSQCQLNEDVRVFVEGNKNIVKPSSTSHMYLLELDESDVDMQRGMVTLTDINPSPSEKYYLYERNQGYYLGPKPEPFWPFVSELGVFNKYRYWNRYFFDSFIPYGFPTGGFGKYQDWGFQWPDGVGLNVTILDDAGMPVGSRPITKKNIEHQFVSINTIPFHTKMALETTPKKEIEASGAAYELTANIFVDDQTYAVDFYLYSSDGNANSIKYHITLVSPDGLVVDSTSTDVNYIVNDETSLKILSVNNPMPGKWQMSPIVDAEYTGILSYITLGRLSSEIKAESLIGKYGHEINVQSELTGLINVPDESFLNLDSLVAYMIIQNHQGIIDSLLLENIQLTDSGYVAGNIFQAVNEGVHSYTMIMTGIYNGYRFERAVYGDFIVENLLPTFSIPDYNLNITNRIVELYLPHYFSCPQCDINEVTFEVGLLNSTFDDDDIYYAFVPETNIITINISLNAPLAEANFSVDAMQEDSIIANSEFRVTYTSPGVPDYLSASDITLNSVNLLWIPRGLEQHWDIKYGTTGFNPETEGTFIAATTERPYLLEDLTQSTSYDFYVRAVYDDDAHSAWSWPASFTTNHLIIADSGDNGQLEPEGNIEITHRNNQLFQVIPTTGYHIDDVLVDGESIGAVEFYLFEDVQQSHTIHAEFAINLYTITAQPNNEEFGTVIGAGDYEHFEEVTLTAIPATGYHFVNWTEDGQEASTDSIYTFMAESERNLTANFAINVYTITAQPNNENFGNVTGAGEYEHFEEVTLTATPTTGYQFLNWTEEDEEVSTDDTFVFIAESPRNFIAHFEPETAVFELDGQEISLYPNPFNRTFTIQNATHVQQVIITNLLGQHILYKQLSGSETETISTENLPKGIYMVHIIMENGMRKTVKMIKK